MRKRLIKSLIQSATVVAVMAGFSLPVHAIKLNEPKVLYHLGQQLSIDIPIELAPGEQLLKAEIAPERVYGVLNIPFPQSLRTATVTAEERAWGLALHIAGGVPRGSEVPVVIELTTTLGHTVRQFSAPIPPAPASAASAPVQSPLEQKTVPVPAKATAANPIGVGRAEVERNSAAQMIVLGNAIGRISHEITTMTNNIAARNSDQEKQIAALTAAVEAAFARMASTTTAAESAFAAETGLLFGAGILGFGLAGILLGGGRPNIKPGSRVRLSAGGRLLEGECVRVLGASGKASLPYRIADAISQAPQTIEVSFKEDDATVAKESRASHQKKPTPQSPQAKSAKPAADATTADVIDIIIDAQARTNKPGSQRPQAGVRSPEVVTQKARANHVAAVAQS